MGLSRLLQSIWDSLVFLEKEVYFPSALYFLSSLADENIVRNIHFDFAVQWQLCHPLFYFPSLALWLLLMPRPAPTMYFGAIWSNGRKTFLITHCQAKANKQTKRASDQTTEQANDLTEPTKPTSATNATSSTEPTTTMATATRERTNGRNQPNATDGSQQLRVNRQQEGGGRGRGSTPGGSLF